MNAPAGEAPPALAPSTDALAHATATFAGLGLRPELVLTLVGLGYEEPTPIHGQRSERVTCDERLLAVIREMHAANYHAYGYRKMWLALKRAGHDVGRDHVKRLMRATGIQGRQAARQAVAHHDARPVGRQKS